MVMIYYGAYVGEAIKIANRGAILSPLEEEIEFLKTHHKPDAKNKLAMEINSGKSFEELAIEGLKGQYNEREFEQRVRNVFVRPDLASALLDIRGINGLVLAVETDLKINLNIPQILIPKSVNIKALKEVHMRNVDQPDIERVKEAFSKYDPNFICTAYLPISFPFAQLI